MTHPPRLPGAGIPLAWRNLTEHKRRLFASLAGVAFAVTLMFMENGFRNALLDSMVKIINHFDCQLVIASRTLYTLSIPYSFPWRRVEQAKVFDGVTSASPLFVENRRTRWRNPATGLPQRICLLAYPPDEEVLDIEPLKRLRPLWSQPDAVMADSRSKSAKFGAFVPDQVSEISGHRVQVVGTFELGVSSQSDGNLVVSDRTFFRIFPDRQGASSADCAVTLGLLRVRDDVDLDRLRASIEAALPPDVRVYTKTGFAAKERDFWNRVAPVGTVFLIGVVLGFIVGMVICYQVLYADLGDRLAEFATLKAMGHSNARLSLLVVAQALYLALMGYAAGLAVSLPLFAWVRGATGLPMVLKGSDALTVLGLTVVMCVLSGCYAARQVFLTDPVLLFD